MGKVTMNHVGVGVPDIDGAIRFYQAALDCRVVRSRFEVRDDAPGGDAAVNVLSPPRFRRMFMAHIATSDGVGIELFQLIDPPHEPRVPQLEYWKSGVFHFCVTDANLESRVQRIVENGGRQLSKVWVNVPPDIRTTYCCDPWGTIIEVSSHTYEASYD